MSNPFYPRKKRTVTGQDLILLRVYRNADARNDMTATIELVGGKHDKKKVEWAWGMPQTWEPFNDGVKYTLDEERYFALVET